jgi:hypothetical protein
MKYGNWAVATLSSYIQDEQMQRSDTHIHTNHTKHLSISQLRRITYLISSHIYNSNTWIIVMVYVNIPGQKIVLSTFGTT